MIGQERNGWPFRIAALRPIQMSPPPTAACLP